MEARLRDRDCEDLARGARRIERWRRSRIAGARIPEDLWQLALNLADEYGISRTAVALNVGYYSLKKRHSTRIAKVAAHQPSNGMEAERQSTSSRELAQSRQSLSGFVELPPVAPVAGGTGSSECCVEYEKPSGARLIVRVKGQSLADLRQLWRDFWEVG